MPVKPNGALCAIKEQIVEDLASGLILQFECSNGHTRLVIAGRALPFGNREIIFDSDGREAAAVLDIAGGVGGVAGHDLDVEPGGPGTVREASCPIGLDAGSGVVDPYHRLHGHDGLHVIDGSTVAANLGVNPSLTITAMAERAVSLWPNKGEVDPRPAHGVAYRRVDPVLPRSPAVPAQAPAAYRLPIVQP